MIRTFLIFPDPFTSSGQRQPAYSSRAGLFCLKVLSFWHGNVSSEIFFGPKSPQTRFEALRREEPHTDTHVCWENLERVVSVVS